MIELEDSRAWLANSVLSCTELVREVHNVYCPVIFPQNLVAGFISLMWGYICWCVQKNYAAFPILVIFVPAFHTLRSFLFKFQRLPSWYEVPAATHCSQPASRGTALCPPLHSFPSSHLCHNLLFVRPLSLPILVNAMFAVFSVFIENETHELRVTLQPRLLGSENHVSKHFQCIHLYFSLPLSLLFCYVYHPTALTKDLIWNISLLGSLGQSAYYPFVIVPYSTTSLVNGKARSSFGNKRREAMTLEFFCWFFFYSVTWQHVFMKACFLIGV